MGTTSDDAARRFAGQWLAPPRGRSVEDVVAHLLAVQAQDLRGARLAVRARSVGLTTGDVDVALAQRRLVVSWLNRGTLHLVTADDYWWLHPLTTPQLATSNRRRLAQEGVSPEQAERGVQVVADTVAELGPSTRAVLRDHLDAAGVPTAGQALIHVIFAAALRGLVVRGAAVGPGEQAFALTQEWLGPPPDPLPTDEALGRLAARYTQGHVTGTPADLAVWAGIGLGAARTAFEVAGLPVDGSRPGPRSRTPPPTRLLGPFDPVLHGWPDRTWVLGPHTHVVTTNGIFKAVAVVRGRAVGGWTLPKGRVELRLFDPVDDDDVAALVADAHDVHRFLGVDDGQPVVLGTG